MFKRNPYSVRMEGEMNSEQSKNTTNGQSKKVKKNNVTSPTDGKSCLKFYSFSTRRILALSFKILIPIEVAFSISCFRSLMPME